MGASSNKRTTSKVLAYSDAVNHDPNEENQNKRKQRKESESQSSHYIKEQDENQHAQKPNRMFKKNVISKYLSIQAWVCVSP